MAQRQYFGVKFPFSVDSIMNHFVDLNGTRADGVRSQLMHIVFTPKGQRLRDPEFGTDLIKYIFTPNDKQTWDSIKTEIKSAVRRYINNVTINNISVAQSDDERAQIFVRLDYSVSEGNLVRSDSIVVEL
jgi:Phage baseplate assembly protein W